MKKPLPVKIVEALGWVYVALAVLLVGGAVIEVCQSVYCDKSILILFALTPLSLTVGMVLSLRQGRRFWFLLGHTVIGLIGSTVVLLTQNEELVTFAASCFAAPVFVAAPFFLLCCSSANRWAEEKTGNSKELALGCGCTFVLGLLLFLCVVVFPVISISIESAWKSASLSRLTAQGRAVFVDMVANRQAQEEGTEWVDPAVCTNSTQFIHALAAKSGHDIDCADFWCVAVNPPDDDLFPVLVSANVDPRELLNPPYDDDLLKLVCPEKAWNGTCRRICEEGAVVVFKSGAALKLWSKYMRPRHIFWRGNSPPRCEIPVPRPDTYYLTPTGRVDLSAPPPRIWYNVKRMSEETRPICHVVAGPNGSGKLKVVRKAPLVARRCSREYPSPVYSSIETGIANRLKQLSSGG